MYKHYNNYIINSFNHNKNNHLMTRSLTIKIASQSLPLNKCVDLISSVLIDSLLYGRRENVSILCFVASTDNQGLVLSYPPPAPAPLPILLRWLELKPGMPVVLWTATEAPSQCQRDPSSEHVNKLSGLRGWNFTSHTDKKNNNNMNDHFKFEKCQPTCMQTLMS